MASFVRSSIWISALTLAWLGCGDDGSAGPGGGSSTGDATTSGPGATSTDSSADGTSSGVATSATSTTGTPEESSTSVGTTRGDTASDGSSEGSTGSTGEGMATTGDQGNVVYSAIALPGGLDRIRISKADLDDDRCTWVVLVTPPFASMYPGLTVPVVWSVESASINDVAAACDSDNPFMFGSEPALDASGSVVFGPLGGTGIYPCTVDIDATFDFQGILPGIPPTDDMLATGIPVTGC